MYRQIIWGVLCVCVIRTLGNGAREAPTGDPRLRIGIQRQQEPIGQTLLLLRESGGRVLLLQAASGKGAEGLFRGFIIVRIYRLGGLRGVG